MENAKNAADWSVIRFFPLFSAPPRWNFVLFLIRDHPRWSAVSPVLLCGFRVLGWEPDFGLLGWLGALCRENILADGWLLTAECFFISVICGEVLPFPDPRWFAVSACSPLRPLRWNVLADGWLLTAECFVHFQLLSQPEQEISWTKDEEVVAFHHLQSKFLWR